MMAGMNISKIAYIQSRHHRLQINYIILYSLTLNDIAPPAIPEPAQKKAGDRSNQAGCPVNWMRVSIQRYSSYDITH